MQAEKKRETPKDVKIYAIIAAVMIIGAVVYGNFSSDTNNTKSAKQAIPIISNEAKSLAIEEIEAYPMVKDADFKQKGKDITLVLIVGYATSNQQAKEFGDNFVRLVKSFSEDDPPKKDIGSGKYTYTVGVFYPNEKQVALGAKVSNATFISW